MNERRAYCRIEWLPSVQEKTARARSFQAMASINKVMVPMTASGKAELLGQLTRFPPGNYDNRVDVCSLIGRGLKMMPAPSAGDAGRRKRGRFFVEYDPFPYPTEERSRGILVSQFPMSVRSDWHGFGGRTFRP
jgi:hypothetical protein